ncbi:Similar to AAEL000263: Zinc finger protein jing homolog (Aedes aegypti) [Cotesia congregata]|uniref:Similar to AAEL000263: Zinc finger protein jing homolog (Aedes aegypti) n=1 Tax=Cotesia congregata TaxID=51543 RepID=A0A8J2HM81_COTCN|nr:Similar to AAEL000263: Zinc finger protein jing homolog (Aedes aegypti) [Cotesia congregata]
MTITHYYNYVFSGVAVSCGDCSSSGTSDITEPGSPCSTSSDEGVAIHGKAPSPLPSIPKLAPQTSPLLNGTRPQWPWTPPLADTACSTYKRLNSEPEIGTLPKVTAADPTVRSTKTSNKLQHNHHQQHELQGKITEYFKTQIKPQQSKTKKNSADMSVMVAKNSPEFRRPLTVQRNKGGLAKYLGVVTPNSRSVANDWDVKSMGIPSSQLPGNKKLSSVTPRVSVMKLDKLFVNKTLPGLPISSDVLSSIPGCKISSLRLTGEASPKPSGESPPSTPTPTLEAMRSVKEDDEEEEEEEEDSSRSSESKPSSSPILCEPTTIRFPARAPTKNGARAADSGICRTSCSRRWLERHVLSHGGNKPFRCIVDGCGNRFSSQIALERHVNNHFNQPETSSSSSRRSCENGGKLVRRNGKKLRYRRQPWSARLFDYFDNGVMEGLQHRLLELAKSRTQGQLASTPGNSMALTSQVLAKRVETDGKTRVLLRWHPQDIAPDEWVLESEVINTKHIDIRKAATTSIDEVSLVLYPAVQGGTPPATRVKQRRKPVKNS